MIPELYKTEIITNGMHFMRSITEAYGADEGMRLWDTIASTLDPDIKGQIFMAMITGEYNSRITIKGIEEWANAVACIKEIRTWTGVGLKEAKDMYDKLKYSGPAATVQVLINPNDYNRAVLGLRKVGFRT